MDNQLAFIESSLNYSLYLAENDFICRSALLDNKEKYVTESEYVILNEALLDIIRQYISKVVTALSASFEKFKQTMNDQQVNDVLKLINNNRNLLTTDFKMRAPDNFEIPNIKKWTENLFKTISNEFKPFDIAQYNGWKTANALESAEAYIEYNFKSIDNLGIENGSLTEKMHSFVYGNSKNETGYIVNADNIPDYVDFLENYKNEVDTIAKQIDVINTSNRNIDQYLSSITAAKESYIGSNRILSILYEDNSKKFVNAEDPDGELSKKNDNNEDRKFIVNFFKANTQILSAEMKTINKIRKSCSKITKNYISLQLKENKGKQNQQIDTNGNNTNTGGVATVNTSI